MFIWGSRPLFEQSRLKSVSHAYSTRGPHLAILWRETWPNTDQPLIQKGLQATSQTHGMLLMSYMVTKKQVKGFRKLEVCP